MDILMKLFPIRAKAEDKDSLIKSIIIYAIGMIIGYVVGGLAGVLLGWIPVVGGILTWVIGTICWLLGIYCTAGIVVSILCFCKVIK